MARPINYAVGARGGQGKAHLWSARYAYVILDDLIDIINAQRNVGARSTELKRNAARDKAADSGHRYNQCPLG